jgi:hypothetical protein
MARMRLVLNKPLVNNSRQESELSRKQEDEPTKTYKKRPPISLVVAAIMSSPELFGKAGFKMEKKSLERQNGPLADLVLEKVAKKYGETRPRLRDLRTTTATSMAHIGVPISEIAERLGKKSIVSVLNHYAKSAPIDLLPGESKHYFSNMVGQKVLVKTKSGKTLNVGRYENEFDRFLLALFLFEFRERAEISEQEKVRYQNFCSHLVRLYIRIRKQRRKNTTQRASITVVHEAA